MLVEAVPAEEDDHEDLEALEECKKGEGHEACGVHGEACADAAQEASDAELDLDGAVGVDQASFFFPGDEKSDQDISDASD